MNKRKITPKGIVCGNVRLVTSEVMHLTDVELGKKMSDLGIAEYTKSVVHLLNKIRKENTL